ncbi:MAG: cytochrome-c oxidase, cbb3-type subunit II [Gammaproteobacteria bacterium]|nr:MAG: cytochrome-c oxidase, cbb3-type subunit II [Gammaproteobacteria bacterium]RKZ39797.1 MAG: cytochrome-c oxidase, cbb3-type subunit II [Gammaproteobacteria bacterium]RKZ73241.1 MAG: cytochrome-c oxidase, cbb3-type subunit II [Gammaproteobacteria bacterium]
MAAAHEKVEKNIGLMIILIVIVVSIGGLVQIVPLFFMNSMTEPVEGLKPYPALQLAGRDIYIRESCMVCHSQMIRPFRAETERYGHYSVAGEFVYDRPFQWGSKRTGPDLHRVGGRYSDEWHYAHLINPRDVVPESVMPGYPSLEDNFIDGKDVQHKMQVLKDWFDHPYTVEEIANAPKVVDGKTEMDALIAYLQDLGTTIKTVR